MLQALWPKLIELIQTDLSHPVLGRACGQPEPLDVDLATADLDSLAYSQARPGRRRTPRVHAAFDAGIATTLLLAHRVYPASELETHAWLTLGQRHPVRARARWRTVSCTGSATYSGGSTAPCRWHSSSGNGHCSTRSEPSLLSIRRSPPDFPGAAEELRFLSCFGWCDSRPPDAYLTAPKWDPPLPSGPLLAPAAAGRGALGTPTPTSHRIQLSHSLLRPAQVAQTGSEGWAERLVEMPASRHRAAVPLWAFFFSWQAKVLLDASGGKIIETQRRLSCLADSLSEGKCWQARALTV